MHNDHNKITLGSEVSFAAWKMTIQAKLGRKNVLGHVFHTMTGIHPIKMPQGPETIDPANEDLAALTAQYLMDLEPWVLGEIEAQNIITQRLSTPMCPSNYDELTAKQLFDTVVGSRQETATAPFAIALERFLGLKFESNADSYIDQFLSSYQAVNNEADGMTTQSSDSEYRIGNGVASAMYVSGTRKVEWLNTWMGTWAYESNNQYAPLQVLMSFLGSVASNRVQQPSLALAATLLTGEDLDPNEYCKLCRHRHKNIYCYRLHPELASRQDNHRNKG